MKTVGKIIKNANPLCEAKEEARWLLAPYFAYNERVKRQQKESWVVYGETGCREAACEPDWRQWIVAIVNDEDDAKMLVTILQRQYLKIPKELLYKNLTRNMKAKRQAIMWLDPKFDRVGDKTEYSCECVPHLSYFELRQAALQEEVIENPLEGYDSK